MATPVNNDNKSVNWSAQHGSGIPQTNTGYGAYQNQRAPGVEGVLARLFGLITLEITGGKGLSVIQWTKLISDYVREIDKNNIGLDRMSIRGNLNKEFRRPKMTMPVFCKGARFLKFPCIHLGITAQLESGKTISAGTGITFVSIHELRKKFGEEAVVRFLANRDRQFNTSQNAWIAAAIEKNAKAPEVGDAPVKLHGIPYGPNQRRSKPTGNVQGVLPILFDKLCLSASDGHGITHTEWNRLMNEYVDKNHSDLSHDKKVAIRGNLNKGFRKSRMTWKEFCKAIRFLTATSFTITFSGIREDGYEYECSTRVNFAAAQSKPRFSSFMSGENE